MSSSSPPPEPRSPTSPATVRRGGRRWPRGLPTALWVAAVVGAIAIRVGPQASLTAPAQAEREVFVVGALESAPVAEVFVREGQRVRVGDRLARLSLDALEVELELARAELERLELQVPAERLALALGAARDRATFEAAADAARLALAERETERDRLESEGKALDREIERVRKLVDQQLATRESLDALLLRREANRSRLDSARSLVESATNAAQQASSRVARATSDGAAGRLAPLEAAAAAQRRRVQALEGARGRYVVRAPATGVVRTVHARSGSVVATGDPLVTLLAEDARRVIAYVDENADANALLGGKVRLVSRGSPSDTLSGRVLGLAPAVEPLPARFAPVIGLPRFARGVFVELSERSRPAVPGEAFDATFTAGAPSRPKRAEERAGASDSEAPR